MKSLIVKPYKKYMIVWMDILGFEDKVNKASNNQKEIKNIVKVLEEAKKLAEAFNWSHRSVKVKSQSFSDNIVIVCPKPDTNAVCLLFIMVSLYQISMVAARYFLRGAAAIDSHYSKGNIVFGPGIIQAVRMEKKAVWPRVIIVPNLQQNIEPVSQRFLNLIFGILGVTSLPTFGKNQLEELDRDFRNAIETLFLTRSEEGFQYVNYLRLAFDLLAGIKWVSEYAELDAPELVKMPVLSVHKDAIVKEAQAKNVKHDHGLLAKYHSLAVYHNSVVDTLYDSLAKTFDPTKLTLSTDLDLIYCTAHGLFMAKKVGISEEEKEDFLNKKISALSKNRHELIDCKIELSKVFPALYT